MYLPINEHGLIGDLHTAALVGTDGRMVWLPWPRFDSPSIFAALLDHQRGGDWQLAPVNATSTHQRYDGLTAILITEWETPTGKAELVDWMTPWDSHAPDHDLFRILRCTQGQVEITGRFAPQPDYARQPAVLHSTSDGVRFDAHGVELQFVSDHSWTLDENMATLHTTLQAGASVACVLHSGQPVSLADMPARFAQTRTFWQTWIDGCQYPGTHWRSQVHRSAITLKLLTYAPTGAIIAAPTTSLPEWIGSVRNWDYRYTWLRDASFALLALYRMGYDSEARAFFTWLGQRAVVDDPPLQIMYGVGGEADLTEAELAHLEGYRGSRPVRTGNGAYNQSQLDVYGGVIGAAYLYEQRGDLLLPQHWADLRAEIDYVCAHWQDPDQGIWEMRGPPLQHVFSKLMCWVTLDRGIKLAEFETWPYDHERWSATRDEIRDSILTNGWNERRQAFTIAYGSDDLDASVLVMPIINFLPATDARVVATIERIQTELSHGALVYRYQFDDGLPGPEGAFLLCSFWLVEALALAGRLEQATAHFEELLDYASCHGLLPEEVDPQTGTALGNYPQAFSHIGLINSAFALLNAQNGE